MDDQPPPLPSATSTATEAGAAAPSRRPSARWWALFTVMTGTIASIMSSTMVNVAIPDMSHVFALGQERAQWMSTGFMSAKTISMLATPWLASLAPGR